MFILNLIVHYRVTSRGEGRVGENGYGRGIFVKGGYTYLVQEGSENSSSSIFYNLSLVCCLDS